MRIITLRNSLMFVAGCDITRYSSVKVDEESGAIISCDDAKLDQGEKMRRNKTAEMLPRIAELCSTPVLHNLFAGHRDEWKATGDPRQRRLMEEAHRELCARDADLD